MFDWPALLNKPDPLNDIEAVRWFDQIATRLLCGTKVMIAGQEHRFTEIEFYYCGDGHADEFAHKDPVQRQNGRWYFHKTGGRYRSASFKGLDLAFGDGKAFAGVLLRGVARADDTLIDGPSLFVDHILALNNTRSVADFDKTINERVAWDTTSPLHLVATEITERSLVRCPRVGLTLKRATTSSGHTSFIVRPYRYLSEPKKIAKGKAHMVLGLYQAGHTPEEISAMTGCPKKSVTNYITEVELGRKEADFAAYFGAEVGTTELCRMLGLSSKTVVG